jgi:hypothetical protein
MHCCVRGSAHQPVWHWSAVVTAALRFAAPRLFAVLFFSLRKTSDIKLGDASQHILLKAVSSVGKMCASELISRLYVFTYICEGCVPEDLA